MIPKPTFSFEESHWEKGYHCIGLDEVGRGAFAGPVVVGAVVFPPQATAIEGIHDSKLLSAHERERLSSLIMNQCLAYSIATVGVPVINKIGIGKATSQAFRSVVRHIAKDLAQYTLYALIDGFHVKYLGGISLKRQQAIIQGDRKSISIAAASILAKVYRDKVMKELAGEYPSYSFDVNKGYGTASHRKAITTFGLSKLHRTSFSLQKYVVT